MERTIQKLNSLHIHSNESPSCNIHTPIYSESDIIGMRNEFERITVDQERHYQAVVEETKVLKRQVALKDIENRELARTGDALRQSQHVVQEQQAQISSLQDEIKRLQQMNYTLMVHLQQKPGKGPDNASSHPPPSVF